MALSAHDSFQHDGHCLLSPDFSGEHQEDKQREMETEKLSEYEALARCRRCPEVWGDGSSIGDIATTPRFLSHTLATPGRRRHEIRARYSKETPKGARAAPLQAAAGVRAHVI